MKVSVLLPVYNGERFIERAIRSVLEQTCQDFELIIINDGSTDHTASILSRYCALRNIWIFGRSNKGVAKALEYALNCAAGEYITFISHDDWWLPVKLEEELKALDASSQRIGVVYSDFYKYYEATKTEKPVYASPHAHAKILHECGINISSAMIRRSTLLQLKEADGYILDQTMKDCIDWDLWIRLAKICYFKHIPKLLTYYSIHSKQMTSSLSHDIAKWRVHLKWNGLDPNYFIMQIVRSMLRKIKNRALGAIHYD